MAKSCSVSDMHKLGGGQEEERTVEGRNSPLHIYTGVVVVEKGEVESERESYSTCN